MVTMETNKGQTWNTQSDRALLITIINTSPRLIDFEAIAGKVGRTPMSCRSRLSALRTLVAQSNLVKDNSASPQKGGTRLKPVASGKGGGRRGGGGGGGGGPHRRDTANDSGEEGCGEEVTYDEPLEKEEGAKMEKVKRERVDGEVDAEWERGRKRGRVEEEPEVVMLEGPAVVLGAVEEEDENPFGFIPVLS